MINVKNAISKLIEIDPYLKPFTVDIAMHLDRYNAKRKAFAGDGNVYDAADGHLYYGFHRTEDGWVFREWLPGADSVWLFGDFNGWDRGSHPLTNIGGGVWEIKLLGRDALKHGQYVKLIVGRQGLSFERVPAYVTRAVLDINSKKLCGQIWAPEEEFKWTDEKWYGRKSRKAPLIYEAHIGMAQEYAGIGTYVEFADKNLDRIKSAGYNTIQLMAIQEHPYYASFGYQVTNFFAPSHRYGTPEELKYLINKAHNMGISVVLDVVHSHACPNVGEGLNMQDGTEDQYFLYGGRGWHSAWGTKWFD